VFRQLPGAVWTTDRELHATYVAGRLAEAPRPALGKSVFDFVGTHDPTHTIVAHHLAAVTGEPQSFECEFRGRWYAVLIEPLRDEQDRVTGCIGSAFDITERRATERRLIESEARLAQAQRVAHVGSFEWDVRTNLVTWSEELCRIYGLQPGQFAGTYEAFLAFVHADDLDATRAVVFDALRGGTAFEYDHRIVRADGAVRMLHTRGEAISDASGKPIKLAGSCWDVTELKEAMAGLERAHSLLKATLEATADGLLVVDQRGKITAYNQRFLGLWHIPPELAESHDDERLLSYVLDQLEDPDTFLHDVRELYRHPERESFDVLRFKDGRVFERFSIPRRLGKDIVGRVWSFRDVSERERLFRRALFLSDAARLLASLDFEPALDSVASMCVPLLGDGCAVDLLGNGGPRRLLAVSRDPRRPINPELHGSALAGYPSIYQVGQDSFMAVPLVVKGAVIGAMTFVAAPARRYAAQDLELAEELARRAALSVENARLYRGAKEALKARDEFLSIAAHEIRGPITSIHAAVQGLQRGNLPPAVLPRILEIVEREDRKLARFVDELLDVGRIRGGTLRFSFEPVDLGEIVQEACRRMNAEFTRVGSSLSLTIDRRALGQWDKSRIDQVATHLLLNAIKFGLGKPITVKVGERDGLAELVVQDHGIGIPADMLDRIFQPFERAVSLRHYGGLGLGLFITRTIVEGLGGSISVQSEPSVGSTFTVELPTTARP
jgi:PAS domain S-box-containing protein